MVYITHLTPTARSDDTPLGKVIGYMSEMIYYLQREADCAEIDAVCPEWFPINYVDDIIIDWIKGAYNKKYQSVYNEGANKGNSLNNQVLGWINDLKNKLTTDFNNLLNDAKTKLQTQINEFTAYTKTKIAELDELTKNSQTDIEKAKIAINDAVRDIQTHASNIKELFDRVKELEKKTSEQTSNLDWLRRSVLKL